jgi:hypothetical protein
MPAMMATPRSWLPSGILFARIVIIVVATTDDIVLIVVIAVSVD